VVLTAVPISTFRERKDQPPTMFAGNHVFFILKLQLKSDVLFFIYKKHFRFTGVVDPLPFQVLEGYRYKANQQRKEEKAKLDVQKRTAEDDGEESGRPKIKRVRD
jgi:hypothetical protein